MACIIAIYGLQWNNECYEMGNEYLQVKTDERSMAFLMSFPRGAQGIEEGVSMIRRV